MTSTLQPVLTQETTVAPLASWLPAMGGFTVIAGPCSAESESQVLATAHALADGGKTTAFRAGVWKPRTRPGSFEGIGLEALPWLRRVKAETGLKLAIEVAKAEHVELALDAGIDILWLGARTTVNPFSVQEIADALKGTGVSVLVKNPIHAELALWIGAVERILGSGITQLAAVHRGFAGGSHTGYRNRPEWPIPIEFRRLMPEIPLLNDPSHITGKSEAIATLCQQALDLNFDGLMIEVHPSPEQAWSDPKQQLTPAQFHQVIQGLIKRNANSDDVAYQQQLQFLRDRLDVLDREILYALAQRNEIVKDIAQVKKANNVAILQMDRWNKVIMQMMGEADRLGLSTSTVKRLYELIHDASLEVQSQIIHHSE